MEEVGFGLIVKAWNGGSWFWHDCNLGMVKVGFGLTGMAKNGKFWF
jgi:hypothetical protein